jgi:hypothetical protein
VDPADVDGDGDVDLLAAINTSIVWYENIDGKGRFGPQQIITRFGGVTPSAIATDVDGDGDLDVVSALEDRITWYENFSPQAGDANRDWRFDQEDVAQVLLAGKYLTREPATWEEGDWNEDETFDQLDIVAALHRGSYLQGYYTALRGPVAPTLNQEIVEDLFRTF